MPKQLREVAALSELAAHQSLFEWTPQEPSSYVYEMREGVMHVFTDAQRTEEPFALPGNAFDFFTDMHRCGLGRAAGCNCNKSYACIPYMAALIQDGLKGTQDHFCPCSNDINSCFVLAITDLDAWQGAADPEHGPCQVVHTPPSAAAGAEVQPARDAECGQGVPSAEVRAAP